MSDPYPDTPLQDRHGRLPLIGLPIELRIGLILHSESASGNGSSSSSGNQDTRASFGSDLASLITQTSQGNAPQGLQSAFSQLVSDLQGTPGATTTAGSSGSTASVSLQDLLTKLQAQLGHGSPASGSAVGNLLSATA
ncbi:MAG: hypothetical protein U1F50_15970 [Rubrivivax sp.]